MHVVVRSNGDPLALLPAIRRVLGQLDPSVPGRDFRTLERIIGDSLTRERYLSAVLAVFASAALLLAGLGVFGLFSFTVAERTRELAVRAALGARRTEVMAMVLGDALKLTGAGLAFGTAGALAATRLLQGQLHGVSAVDPATFGAVIVVLGFTAIAASLLPAHRAAAVDPMTVLRRD
jgi:ABC-type antimicrobial peptide transport system permease subunit